MAMIDVSVKKDAWTDLLEGKSAQGYNPFLKSIPARVGQTVVVRNPETLASRIALVESICGDDEHLTVRLLENQQTEDDGEAMANAFMGMALGSLGKKD